MALPTLSLTPLLLRQTAPIYLLLLFLAPQINIFAQPANDLFQNRIALSGTNVSTAISFAGATLDPVPETDPFAVSDIWYSWTPLASGSFKVEAKDELGYSYNLRVYSGTELSTLALLNPLQLEHVYAVAAGVSYTIRLGKGSNHDVGELSLRFIPAVTNDFFEDRIQLTGDSVQWEAWSPDATYNPGEPVLPEIGRNAPVTWWKWTAPANGQVYVPGNGIMVFEGDELANLLWLPYGFEAIAGREYQIAIPWVFGGNPITLSLSLYRFLPYSGLEPNATYPHFPTRTLDWQEFPEAASITNFTLSIDGSTFGSTFIQTNRLVNVPLPILSEGVHRLNASARSSLGFNYILKPFEFYITHPNSSFTNRITLAGDVVTFEADFRGVRDYLWWSWTAPFSGQVTFEDLDRTEYRLDLFSGPSRDQLTWIEGGRVQQGATYIIRGAGFGAIGRFRLRLFPVPPLNDNFSNSREISGNQFSDWICVPCATTEPGEPVSMRGTYGKTLWYSFVPPANGIITIFPGSGIWNWDATIFTGSSLDSLQEIKRPVWDFSQYAVQAGQSYHIRIQSGVASPAASEIRFQFNIPPANDHFVTATKLSGDQTHFTAEMNATTSETDEPGYSSNRHSAWWRWTPQSSGFATLSIPGIRGKNNSSYYSYDIVPWPIREIFRGDTLAELAFVPFAPLHDEVIGFPVEAGVTYSIRLSYLKPIFVPEIFEIQLNVGQLHFINPAFESVFLLPQLPLFQWASPILTNSTTQVELVEQVSFSVWDFGLWVNTASRGIAAWPDFTVTSTNFSSGHKRVFARAQSADGTIIYAPPIDFFLATTLPLRLELFRPPNQPQYFSLRELSDQRVGVESSTDLKNWVTESFIQQGSTVLIEPQPGNSRRFYRSTLR